MHLTSGSGTALLDRLERAGFIRRIPNPDDRRSLLVQLDSERAQGAVKRFKELEQIFVQESSGFTEGELRKVAEFIQDVGEITSGVRNLD
ncbi:MarR family transcriptional regulator [Microvirga tunisiensis]|uniref:MarR family transcriptional regulator n=1 Tax=Microvirga tunisiensis TaxID=2108360 RepID=A0A5N7MU94_9HYPH|nr:MarR family transcriptional regulator [Microvirga tunisiensis]MPR27616.1 MarR family transcriptional regulator [Microvirga tunisiensis]